MGYTGQVVLYFLDLVGVFAFAFFGAHAGLKQRFTLFGILTCVFLPALGGGTIREVLLGHPPIYFSNYSYGLAVVLAVIFALHTRRFFKVKQYMYILDALGMAIFAYLGARAALAADLGIAESIVFAALTACGGGILCDLLTRQTPHAFHNRLYVFPSIFSGAFLWIMGITNMPAFTYVFILVTTFLLQLGITYPQLPRKWARAAIKKTNEWLKNLLQSLSAIYRG